MKTKQFILCFLLCTVMHGLCFAQNLPEEKAISTLKSFYTEYITHVAKPPSRDYVQGKNKIQQKYCTQKLLNHVDSLRVYHDLDFDPFLQAQDYSLNWIETMVIKKEPTGENIYNVYRWGSFDEKYEVIKVSVVEEEGEYKIDALLNIYERIVVDTVP